MDNFNFALNSTAPIFLVILVGWLLRRVGVLDDGEACCVGGRDSRRRGGTRVPQPGSRERAAPLPAVCHRRRRREIQGESWSGWLNSRMSPCTACPPPTFPKNRFLLFLRHRKSLFSPDSREKRRKEGRFRFCLSDYDAVLSS